MKRTYTGLLCFLLAALLTLPALAHGHHGGHHGGGCRNDTVQREITVCAYEDCDTAGRHTHDGVVYCGYAHASGVCDGNCRPLCTEEDCQLTGLHSHDGVSCCGNDHDAGFCGGTCLPLCTEAGCKLTGLHSHDGLTCCGNDHDAGFCEGACPTASRHCRRWQR